MAEEINRIDQQKTKDNKELAQAQNATQVCGWHRLQAFSSISDPLLATANCKSGQGES